MSSAGSIIFIPGLQQLVSAFFLADESCATQAVEKTSKQQQGRISFSMVGY
jgi:hypothetical protein